MTFNEAIKAAESKLGKIYADVVRADGTSETIDLSGKFCCMTTDLAKRIRTESAKKGTIVKRIYGVKITSNLGKLEEAWNNLHNEGGEGYIPDFSDDPRSDAKIGTAEYLA